MDEEEAAAAAARRRRRCRRRRKKKKDSRAVATPARDPMIMPARAPLERLLLELEVGEARLEGRVARLGEVVDEDVAFEETKMVSCA